MPQKKIVFLAIIFLGLTLACSTVFAARLVPKLNPLQPLPLGTSPNVTENINSKNSEINKNQQLEQQQIDTGGVNSNLGQEGKPVGQTAPTISQEPVRSAAYYWVLLILGLIGLTLCGLLLYRKLKFKK
jgi:hypothetical protein